MYPRLLIALLPLAVATPAAADTLLARIVDSNGVGIFNGDVDAFNRDTGMDQLLTGDSSDINGFINVTLPAGRYDLTFQGPVGSNYFEVEIRDVDIAGTFDAGVIVLEDGFRVTGRVLDTNGFPVANCDLDAVNLTTGMTATLTGDRTDVFGNFDVLVPANSELIFDPRTVIGPLLAPRAFLYSLQANTNIGDITLFPGLTVSGSVRRPNGQALAGADLDFTDSNGDEAFLHGDTTDALGNFSVVVAADTYEVQVCPPGTSTFASLRLDSVPVAGTVNLGALTLPAGVLLFGTLRDGIGQGVPGADVDVLDAATGTSLPLCGDGTNALGAYSVRVPAGTYNVLFSKPGEFAVRGNVLVAVTTQVDEVMQSCASGSSTMRNGSGINPVSLTTLSAPRIARSWRVNLDCSGHAPSFGVIILQTGAHPGIPTFAGEFLLSGQVIGVQSAPHMGDVITFTTPLAPNISLCGRMGFGQGLILGAPGPQLTNAVDLVVGQ